MYICVCIYALVAHHRVGVQTEAHSAMSAQTTWVCSWSDGGAPAAAVGTGGRSLLRPKR